MGDKKSIRKELIEKRDAETCIPFICMWESILLEECSILSWHAIDRSDTYLLVVALSAFALELDLTMVKSVELAVLKILEVLKSHHDIAVHDMDALVTVAYEGDVVPLAVRETIVWNSYVVSAVTACTEDESLTLWIIPSVSSLLV